MAPKNATFHRATSSLLPVYDPALFDAIHKVPTFLPAEENEDSIRFILCVAGVIALVQLVLLQIVKVVAGSEKGSSAEEKRAKSLSMWKASYQLTNLLVNLALGCLGIYYQITKIPWSESVTNQIIGYEHVKLFSMGQIGYQLWALPVGVFFVGETASMILHHVAVICVASVSCFLTCGFRYYIPYFYGLIEISSVPLSIMNAFKNNPSWIKAHPDTYSAVRLIFGLTFLLVRVVLWTPYFWSFFSLAAMLLYSSDSIVTKVILSLFNLSSLVLTLLQYFWASKIVSAMVKGSKKSSAGKKAA